MIEMPSFRSMLVMNYFKFKLNNDSFTNHKRIVWYCLKYDRGLVEKMKWWSFTSKAKIGVAANFPHFDLQEHMSSEQFVIDSTVPETAVGSFVDSNFL